MNTHTRRTRGCSVNPLIRMPAPPHTRIAGIRRTWVDESSCICGARYLDFRAGNTFSDAALALRQLAKSQGDDGGGYRSIRPVLTMLRAMKLDAWFLEHYGCVTLLFENEPQPQLDTSLASG